MPKKTFQLWSRRAGTKTLYANFTVKGLPRFRQSLETDDEQEAQLRAAALKLEAERRARGLIDEKKLDHEITLGQALGKYMLYIREDDKPVAKFYEGYCDELLDFFGNGTLFHTLDTAQVSEFIRHLRQRRFARGGEKKGLANSSRACGRRRSNSRNLRARKRRHRRGSFAARRRWRAFATASMMLATSSIFSRSRACESATRLRSNGSKWIGPMAKSTSFRKAIDRMSCG